MPKKVHDGCFDILRGKWLLEAEGAIPRSPRLYIASTPLKNDVTSTVLLPATGTPPLYTLLKVTSVLLLQAAIATGKGVLEPL
ncbi:hypothetical protein ACTVMJ_03570 [Serratia marcescens]